MGTVYHVMSRRRKATNAKAEAILEKTKNKEAKQNHSFKEADIELQFSSNETASKVHHNKAFANEEGAVSETNDISSPANHTSGKEKVLHQKMKKSDLIDDIMIGFSSINNGSKIMNTEPMAGNLGALNGIRVISMWWIILGHTFSYALVGYYDNTRFIFDKVTLSFLFNGVINAYVAVDTFFFLSGLLLTYLTLKHLKKSSGRLNWFLFYLHRFIRLTPAYMVSIAIWASLAIHFGQGPAKKNFFEAAADACRKYWWTNLLYINNLYPFPGDIEFQCHSWAWYLANDMQFFIISPIIIYLLYNAYNNNTVVVYGSATVDIIYGKPYCRIPAYLVGMVFGYIFCQVQGKPFKMSKFLNLFLWFVSTAVGLAIVFGLYRGEGKDIPQYAAVLYTVFSRPAFVTAVGWVAFACVMGYGGPVNSLLSWGVWAPLSRLTYGAYLLHSTILYTIYTSSNAQYHFSYMQWVCMFLANMILAYGAAFLLSIGVEGPFMGLEKALLGGGVRGKKK
ncbi:nose resistant to fluoxetine protein 6-like [Acanthaster planci]|uniref:Nose resistant to fluoxetine protein 6-like n=1 Tax=Acanthaster planci TaxID=133434 RepID=A0A8B7ZCH4_ACAPL|nr:nose resistant to fluoxetine protein 6-like [Acanthaster planci]